jgi:hypothetical protein
VSDLLERVRAQTRERLQELRPAVDEYERLHAALAVLDGLTPRRRERSPAAPAISPDRSGDARDGGSPAASPPGGSSRDGSSRGSRDGGRRARAPRGANRAAVLEAVRERPGASAGELAAAAGISRPIVYTLLNRLTERGELVRSALPSGGNGYSLPPEPPAAGWSSGNGADQASGQSDEPAGAEVTSAPAEPA